MQNTTNVPTTEHYIQHVDEPHSPLAAHSPTPPSSTPQPNTPPSPRQPYTPLSPSSPSITTSAQTLSQAQPVANHTPFPTDNQSQTVFTHPMVTRAKVGIFKPLEHMNCHVTTTSPLPCSHVRALHNPNRKQALLNEYNALITNRT